MLAGAAGSWGGGICREALKLSSAPLYLFLTHLNVDMPAKGALNTDLLGELEGHDQVLFVRKLIYALHHLLY